MKIQFILLFSINQNKLLKSLLNKLKHIPTLLDKTKSFTLHTKLALLVNSDLPNFPPKLNTSYIPIGLNLTWKVKLDIYRVFTNEGAKVLV